MVTGALGGLVASTSKSTAKYGSGSVDLIETGDSNAVTTIYDENIEREKIAHFILEYPV